ncbi:hypothetical protein PtB15_11B487 [Puccinia triticina]|nr:hypothetical protein PtB15_11B487 [Puccinia triticina]
MDFIVKDNAVGLKLVEELGADKLRFHIMEWVFNPLMAKRSGQIELALNPVPLTIAGRGSIWLVEEIWDQKVQQIVNYEVVVEHVVGDNPFGIVVRLVVAKDMMPPSMDGSYIPGLRVAFCGILIDSEDSGEEIRVEGRQGHLTL